MTFAVHAPSMFRALAVAVCAFSLASAPCPARAANDPNGVYSGTALSGSNTCAQVQIAGHGREFTYSGGTLTRTGNINGELLTKPSSTVPLIFSVSSDTGDATLLIQKGTLRGTLRLGGTANTGTLVVGTGATVNRPTITVTGGVAGSANGFSHIRTNGANLVINGRAGSGQHISQMSALNGNITLTAGSSSAH